MANNDELVIRWLDKPIDAACVFCKGKEKKFDKGPVVSLVSGELVCPRCALAHNRNLLEVCSSYNRRLEEFDLKLDYDNLQLNKFDFKEPIIPDFDDKEIQKINDSKFLIDDTPIFDYERDDKCKRCIHGSFSPRDGPKSTK